jgi:hypothetical protein
VVTCVSRSFMYAHETGLLPGSPLIFSRDILPDEAGEVRLPEP